MIYHRKHLEFKKVLKFKIIKVFDMPVNPCWHRQFINAPFTITHNPPFLQIFKLLQLAPDIVVVDVVDVVVDVIRETDIVEEVITLVWISHKVPWWLNLDYLNEINFLINLIYR